MSLWEHAICVPHMPNVFLNKAQGKFLVNSGGVSQFHACVWEWSYTCPVLNIFICIDFLNAARETEIHVYQLYMLTWTMYVSVLNKKKKVGGSREGKIEGRKSSKG